MSDGELERAIGAALEGVGIGSWRARVRGGSAQLTLLGLTRVEVPDAAAFLARLVNLPEGLLRGAIRHIEIGGPPAGLEQQVQRTCPGYRVERFDLALEQLATVIADDGRIAAFMDPEHLPPVYELAEILAELPDGCGGEIVAAAFRIHSRAFAAGREQGADEAQECGYCC